MTYNQVNKFVNEYFNTNGICFSTEYLLYVIKIQALTTVKELKHYCDTNIIKSSK